MQADLRSSTIETDSARAFADLPGPRPWPVFGHLLQFDLPRLHQQLEGWAVEHGGTYKLRLGPRDVLVVTDAELIAGALRDRPDGWLRMKPIESVLREIGTHGVFSAEGTDWKRQRRLVMAAFDPGHLKRFFAQLVRVTERLRSRCMQAAREGRPIELQSLLMRYTVDVTAGLAFGAEVNTLDADRDVLQDHLDKVFPMIFRRINMPFPYWRYLRLPADRAFDRHLAEVHDAIRGFIHAARQRMRADPALASHPANLLEAMLAARDADGSALSEVEVAGNVFTVLLGGEDTTANTLGWTLYLLHRHRDAWREIVAEADAALGEGALPASFDAARGFDRIEDCVNEAMRLKPVAPLIFLEAARETTVGAYRLPVGTGLFCLMRSASTDATRIDAASTFMPERWREAGEGARVLRQSSMAFGAGPRLCPGRYLALLEMKMVLAMLARNFELVEVATATGEPPAERMAFTMFPVGLRMRLAERRTGSGYVGRDDPSSAAQ